MKKTPQNAHRGRIQAQGSGVEKSESWAKDEPLTYEEGLALIEELKKTTHTTRTPNKKRCF